MPRGIDVTQARSAPLPEFTDTQVSALEALYPARCIGTAERLEDHLRHAGKVELIAQLRSRVSAPSQVTVPGGLEPDEEEALLDAEAARLATQEEQQE
jgi:hypothetical protein